ncbi:MAG TPA: ATP-binding protein [Rhodocyclaceae bacterium]
MAPNPPDRLGELLDGLQAAFDEFLAYGGDSAARRASDRLCDMAAQGGVQHDEGVRQIALSLLSFLSRCGTAPPGEDDRKQIAGLLESLRRAAGSDAADGDLPRLVAEVADSGPARNRRVALLIESRAIEALLSGALQAAGYEPEAIARMNDIGPDTGREPPLAVVADLAAGRADPDTRACLEGWRSRLGQPVHLFCLSGADDFAARLDAVRLGATRFLKKPVDVAKLVAVLNGVSQRHSTAPFRALLVEDDRALTEYYQAILGEAGIETQACHDALAAARTALEFAPDVIVSDVYMPGCNGFELAALLRQDESLSDTPILFLSSETDVRQQMTALDLGGDDFLTKPVEPEVFRAAVVARAKRARMAKRIRRELIEARAAAERADQAKSSFLASMSHELRTPLNGVLGYAQLLEAELADFPNADVRQYPQAIRAAGQHLLELINEILDFARIESGRLSLTMEPVAAAALAEECQRVIAPLALKSGIGVTIDVPPDCVVRADRTRLKQVLLNLIGNAVKYNRAHGSVRVAAAAEAGRWRIAVSDTGRGIGSDQMKELFKPFSRLGATENGVEGTGIGLALAKRLTEAMGGQIGATSRYGEGSEFWISLPGA